MRLRTEAQARKQSMLPQLEGGLLTEPVIGRHFVPTRWLATTGPGFRRTRRRYDAGLGCAIGMARGLPRAVAVHTSSELPHLTCLDFEIPDATKMSTSSKLFEPYKLGPITLPNRLVMAPLTRNRAV